MKFYLTGDTHGVFTRFVNLPKDEEIGMIILGDFGINFYLNKTDYKKKKELCANYPNITFYCVRGNHEARPQDIPGMILAFDENVHGTIYIEPEFPKIRYFLDYGFYDIGGYNCYVIGGAYSVDKWWRLQRANLTEETNNPKKSGWFANEQLTKEEMETATMQLYLFKDMGKTIDFMLTHTCPYDWEPRDMFLSSVDQSTVDDSMERWMNTIKDDIPAYVWCFGHYHADRIERSHVEQYYHNIEKLDDIYKRWREHDAIDHLQKGQNLYA